MCMRLQTIVCEVGYPDSVPPLDDRGRRSERGWTVAHIAVLVNVVGAGMTIDGVSSTRTGNRPTRERMEGYRSQSEEVG